MDSKCGKQLLFGNFKTISWGEMNVEEKERSESEIRLTPGNKVKFCMKKIID